ncbi:hypothetical protein AGMMS49928_27960 [Spirochaetia bacterium]|nr:hypothetical protein AGMMS49928_27960 [Spirochaetia bacterium]
MAAYNYLSKMKKILVVLLILATAGGLFAQEEASVKVGVGGHAVFVPFQLVDPDATASQGLAGVGVTWGGQPSLGINIESTGSETAGFKGELKIDNGNSVTIGDFAYIWAKPVSQIKLSLGKFNEDVLRGKIGDGGDLNQFTLPSGGEDDIFKRFQPSVAGNNKAVGFLLGATPVEGLFIGAMVKDLAGAGVGGAGGLTGIVLNDAYDVYESIQVAAGYEIADVGLVRAQYVGGPAAISTSAIAAAFASPSFDPDDITVSANRFFQLAFAYTGMEGLPLTWVERITYRSKVLMKLLA